MNPIDVFNLAAGALGIGVPVGTFGSFLDRKRREKKLAKRYVNDLLMATQTGEVALCLSIGGKSIPEKDIVAYLSQGKTPPNSFLYYATPEGANLADPATAKRVCDDLAAMMKEVGKEKTTRIHLFINGMLAYPFVVGALLGNTTPTLVYYFDRDTNPQTYRPLYQWNPGDPHKPRISAPLAPWRSIPIPATEEA